MIKKPQAGKTEKVYVQKEQILKQNFIYVSKLLRRMLHSYTYIR